MSQNYDIVTIGSMFVEIMRKELEKPLSMPADFTGPYPSGDIAIFLNAAAKLGSKCAIIDTEVRCVAVPVRDFTGQVIGAVGISGPVWRLSLQALQSRAKVVQEAAERLSQEFGARAGA